MKFKVNVVATNKDNDIIYHWFCYMKYSKLIRFLKRVFEMDDDITCIEVRQFDSFHFYARRRRYSSHFSLRIYEKDFKHSRITIEL